MNGFPIYTKTQSYAIFLLRTLRSVRHDQMHWLRESCGIDRAESVLELLTETVCSDRKSIRIGGEDMPSEVVKSRLLKLDHSHVEYVFERMEENTTKIRNIRAYLLTSLYRAPVTIDAYYRAEVNHDLGGG